MKKGGNSKYLGTIVIPKARGVWKSLFRVSAPKKTEDVSISLPHVIVFLSHFRLRPGRRKGLEGTTYPTMDLPVHGESDGVQFVLVEDCIHKL